MSAKRRRPKAEVDAERLAKANAAQTMQAKEDEINDLKQTLQNFGKQNPDLVNRMGFISDLLDNGIVQMDQNGDYQLNNGGV